VLGDALYRQAQRMAGIGAPNPGHTGAPAFSDGWYGYVDKDLRQVLGRKVRGRFSRTYCGRGSRARCRAVLEASLKAALGVTKQQLYAAGDCKGDPDAQCADRNRFTVASAIGNAPMLFQNRPTFQQTVSLTRSVGR
jgi:hypothetical protein